MVLAVTLGSCVRQDASLVPLGETSGTGGVAVLGPCSGADGIPCLDAGVCVGGDCRRGCWVDDAGGFVAPTPAFNDAGGGCLGCHPDISVTSLTLLPEGSACGGLYFNGVCDTLSQLQTGPRPEACVALVAGDKCPQLGNPSSNWTVPCGGKCVGGLCCIVSQAEQIEFVEICVNDSQCCDNGKCDRDSLVGSSGLYGLCYWDAGIGMGR
jgi:hypothetical protein